MTLLNFDITSLIRNFYIIVPEKVVFIKFNVTREDYQIVYIKSFFNIMLQ